jgi:hypothetical protein
MLRPGSGAAGGAEDERFPLFSNHSTKLKMVEGFLNAPNQMSYGHHLIILVHLEGGIMHPLVTARLMLRFPDLLISDRTGSAP